MTRTADHSRTRTSLTACVVVAILSLILAACSTTTTTAASKATTATSARAVTQKKVYTIALSNSYIGNTWRVEMENDFKAACAMAPFKNHVKCSVYNATNNVSSQEQQMSDMIASKVDAIVTDAASPTGLNGTIDEACSRDILVVSFDNTVTAPCALKINESQYQMGRDWAEFIVKKLHGHGNVLMVTGVPGTYVNEQRNAGAESVWKKYPGIHVVDKVNGEWSSTDALRVVSSVLPSLPVINAVWCQGGDPGVVEAFKRAGRPIPVFAGEAENGYREDIANGVVKTGLSIGQAPYLSVIALGAAYDILTGKIAKAKLLTYTVPLSPVVKKNDIEGVAWFKSMPSHAFADVIDTASPPTVKGLCLQAAESGTPCPSGKLTFDFSS